MKYLPLLLIGLLGCTDAEIASHNLSKAAEQFEIVRRTVFYNGITDKYILTIQGRCSIQSRNSRLEVTCKIADGQYKKHFLGLSDNVTYFSEQIDGNVAGTARYRVIFKPSAIIPDVDVE